MDLSTFCEIPLSFSFRHHPSLLCRISRLTQLLYAAPFSFRGNLLPYSNSPHSLSLNHQHLAIMAASHPALTLSPSYVASQTVSTSPPTFSSCSTAYPTFPSHFLQTSFLGRFVVTLFTAAHQSLIHLPHRTQELS